MMNRSKWMPPVLLAGLVALGCDDPESRNGGDAGTPPTDSEDIVYGDAEFSVTVSLSDAISTVGIVEWSVDKTPLDSAVIEFGPDTTYRWSAPVNLGAPNYRTLLLGMKASSRYHFRVIAKAAGVTYVSDDHAVDTGPLPTGLPTKTLTTSSPSALAGGFQIMCNFNGGTAWIYDEDGDIVWWYDPAGGSDCVRARMTYDGDGMIFANGNVPGPSNGTLSRVRMDGAGEETFDVPARHHDVEVMPDGGMVYMEYENTGSGTCDRIVRMGPTGDTSQLFMVRDHFSVPAGDGCHANAINYVPKEDAFTLSILNLDTIVKFSSDGQLLWTFGGQSSDFPDVAWDNQHQHQLLDNGILFFNNGATGFNVVSHVLEYDLDESAFQASLVWDYSSGNLASFSMGDAKRLPNGNTLVVFSNAGAIQEVDAGGDTLREITLGMGSAMGYVEWRRSLYGPPEQYL